MAPRKKKCLRFSTVRLQQNEAHPLFLFSLTGAEISAIADVSRVARDIDGSLIGYQRPEVRRHVRDIVEYLNGDNVLFPNSIILALSSVVKFHPSSEVRDRLVTPGMLEIPLPGPDEVKPAWIVDGQQRVLAISKSTKQDLPVPVNAFVADDVELQRDQFLRVNNTRPLPRGLINELLPAVQTPLPARLEGRRVPSGICDLLHRDPESPFRGMILRASSNRSERRSAVVTDTSLVRMMQDSLSSPSGCLFPYHNLATGEVDVGGVRAVLFAYWGAVKNVFPLAWGKPPTESRLMHGAGIRSMGRLMDRVMSTVNPAEAGVVKKIEQDLQPVAPVCQWTEGRWDELGGLGWNEIQNVPRHIRVLSDFLIRTYMTAKRGEMS